MITRTHTIQIILVGFSVLAYSSSIGFAHSKNGTKSGSKQFAPSTISINNPDLAEQNWVLNCQGCHKVGALGLGSDMPNLNGEISKLLSFQEGIDYIGRVNGIANAPLSDEALTDLVNWMLVTYDPTNIPSEFKGFSVEQIHELRKKPWGYNILAEREKVSLILQKKLRRNLKR